VVHSLEGGGTERVLVSLLRAFDHRTLRHVVITLRDAGSLAAQLPDEVACIALGALGRSRTSGFRLARICARLCPAIIHARNVCTWPDAVMARMLIPGAKLVLGFHGLESGGHFSRRDRCVARIARALGARFTSVSECGQRQMARELGLPLERIEHIPNGIDLSRFDAHATHTRRLVRESFGYLPNERVIGIAGSLTAVKGHDVLLSAVAAVAQTTPDIRLLMVGDGPLRGALEAAAGRLAIQKRVHFTGWREDIPTLLSAMDAYVCASHSEGMSNAVMEAMASGLPLVSTSVGDHPSVIRHGLDGLLVPPGDASALARALQTLFGSPDRAAAMGRSARARIEEFSFARTVAAYQRLYGDIIPQQAMQAHAIARFCRVVSKSVIAPIFPRVTAGAPVK
jgi:glycosyltransferase involved in cell wall biosynthesis